ncbi:hypothetical protein MKX03_020061, partial [Papaver bracteatum]
DELLWAAGWIYQATNEDTYLNYFVNNVDNLGGTGWAMTEFGWDVKYPGAQVLGKAKGNAEVFEQLQEKADYFMCACLGKGSRNVQKTPGGLLFHLRWNNLQFVTSAALLMTVYADYLTTAGKNVQCPRGTATLDELHAMAKSQVDYILGNNPRATSYMVGYGNNFPQQTHRRASLIVSYKVEKSFASDPNVITGAIVGGPDAYDNFADERDNYEQTEPSTYNNAPLLGVLARLNGGNGGYSLGALAVRSPKPVVTKPTPAPKPKPTLVQKAKRTPAPKPKYIPVQKPKPTPVKASSSKISVTQKATTTWNDEGKTYHRYFATVTNNSGKPLKELKLYIDNLYGPVWGLKKSGDAYTFPSWLTSLPAGKSMEFWRRRWCCWRF